jgi:hypothetical protein
MYVTFLSMSMKERSPTDGSVRFIEESTLTTEQHLKGAGIWQALGLR